MNEYYAQVETTSVDGKRSSSWIQQDVMRTMNDRQVSIAEFPVSAQMLGDLIGRVSKGDLDNNRARDVFTYLLDHGNCVDDAIRALGIETLDSGAIESLCQQLLDENPQTVEDFRGGKKQAIGALIGQARKKNPNANPQQVREILMRLIEQAT